jgi:hypothetical protein
MRVVLEKDRFGGEDRGAVGTFEGGFGTAEGAGCFGPERSSPATVA